MMNFCSDCKHRKPSAPHRLGGDRCKAFPIVNEDRVEGRSVEYPECRKLRGGRVASVMRSMGHQPPKHWDGEIGDDCPMWEPKPLLKLKETVKEKIKSWQIGAHLKAHLSKTFTQQSEKRTKKP